MSRSRRKAEEHSGGMERWLLTYADLITLLMAFFVIMYAMSNVDASKYSAMAMSLKIALGLADKGPSLVSPTVGGKKPGNDKNVNTKDKNLSQNEVQKIMSLRSQKEEREFAVTISKIKEYIKQKGIESSLDVKEDARGIVINLADKVLFESGKADLSPSAQQVLDDLAGLLLAADKHIKVEGHTDNVPIHTDRYPSNWQLSTDRATSVIMYWLSKYPGASNRLSASGYGEFRPVAPNDTPENKAKNRRVEIVILRDSISKGEPVSPQDAVSPNYSDKLPADKK